MSKKNIGNPILRKLDFDFSKILKDLRDGTTAESMLAQVQESQAITHERLERLEDKIDKLSEE